MQIRKEEAVPSLILDTSRPYYILACAGGDLFELDMRKVGFLLAPRTIQNMRVLLNDMLRQQNTRPNLCYGIRVGSLESHPCISMMLNSITGRHVDSHLLSACSLTGTL